MDVAVAVAPLLLFVAAASPLLLVLLVAVARPLLLLQLLVAAAHPLLLLLLLLVVAARPLLLLLLLLDAAARLLLPVLLLDGKGGRCHPGPENFPRQARHSGTVESVLCSTARTAATQWLDQLRIKVANMATEVERLSRQL